MAAPRPATPLPAVAQALIAQTATPGDSALAIAQAQQCLERFTQAFNRRDVAGMDACLHFPHQMWAGPQLMTWAQAGSHPADFFAQLCATGWSHTCYESITPVLAAPDKVHCVVDYTRRAADDSVLSRHINLWIAVLRDGRWGIVLRSY